MNLTRPLRIAILAHSTNPRGGVVHALALGDALTRLGHEAVVHAPDAKGNGFFRKTLCDTVCVAAAPAGSSMREMVETRIADYVSHFGDPARRRFDVFHAQDGISGNALATLKERGLIPAFARTIHHVDAFEDQRVAGAADPRDPSPPSRHLRRQPLMARLSARRVWPQRDGRRQWRRPPRFSPATRRQGARVARSLRPARSVRFSSQSAASRSARTRCECSRRFAANPSICASDAAARDHAGGASLLDHGDYQDAFRQGCQGRTPPDCRRDAVVVTGPLAQADLPALYRIADALVFPSVKEGFGLVVLEAMASGVPVIASRIAPFTEYLAEDDVV